MAMWAGVQKVSRPMLGCQETSQCAPMVTDVTARAAAQRYQGMELVRVAVRGACVVAAAAMGNLRFDRVQGAGYKGAGAPGFALVLFA